MSTTFESDWENTRLKEQLAAKDDEIRELVTSDNKVVADLSRYVETLEQKIADKNDAYRAACAVVAKMHEAAIGEVVGPVLGVVEVVANVREQLIEAQKQIVMLREELATTQSELETERRLSFRNQVAELERELFAMNGEITALKIQLLNRNVSNLEASANFAMTDMQQQLAAKDDEIQKLVTSDNKVIVDLSRYVETLEQQIADRDEQISDLTISSDTYFAERNSARDVWRRASKDRDELRQQLTAAQDDASTAWAQAHRLALELECLIMDTKDDVIVSKWWDSAFDAIEEYNKLKPGAAEDAEAWAKMRKAGI